MRVSYFPPPPCSSRHTQHTRQWCDHASTLCLFSPAASFFCGALLLAINQPASRPCKRHNCHYDCCSPAHTQRTDCSAERGGGCLPCADATQYYYSVTTARLHTHTGARKHTFFFLSRCRSLPVIFSLSINQTHIFIGLIIYVLVPFGGEKKNTQTHTQCHLRKETM